ncbi:hypothetical protein H9636_16130 [Ureibacillus sp. Re31]|uniref:Uncharacterized protein n=1 Tax=Ureibacillus galli TaxID=2762222 RepID=A0ABR8XG29_9BACL|nr:hypothetical protein [Ureibacillus galli]MBD8028177.1 hypothetical protein [Ureibacillus galli]
MMDKQKAVDLINTMPIIFYDTDYIDDEFILYTATVEDNEMNRNIIKSLGYTDEEIDRLQSHRKREIELTHFVWNYADWYDGYKFIIREDLK